MAEKQREYDSLLQKSDSIMHKVTSLEDIIEECKKSENVENREEAPTQKLLGVEKKMVEMEAELSQAKHEVRSRYHQYFTTQKELNICRERLTSADDKTNGLEAQIRDQEGEMKIMTKQYQDRYDYMLHENQTLQKRLDSLPAVSSVPTSTRRPHHNT
jgi:chromosome segregation ATPase